MAPRAPPKRKKTKKRVFLVIGDPNGLPKKFSAIFGAGCRKVCCCSLNGAMYKMYMMFGTPKNMGLHVYIFVKMHF